MAVDLERVRLSVASFRAHSPEARKALLADVEQTIGPLQAELPALNILDQAAVAWYIAGLLAELRRRPIGVASEVITSTAIGYSLGAAKLYGLLEEAGEADG